jgi:hypothetical protein
MAAYVGNIVGLGEAPKLSLDSTFYTPSDLVVNNSPAGSRVSAMHDGAPYTAHSGHPVPYRGHAGLDPVSRAMTPYLSRPALDMTSLEPSLKPVPIYSASKPETRDTSRDDMFLYASMKGGASAGLVSSHIFLDKEQQREHRESMRRGVTEYIFNPNPTLGFKPKTLADIGRNLSAEYSLVGAIRAMVDPDASAGAKFKYSPMGFGTAFSGELNEYVLGKIYEHAHKVPLVKGALDLMGAGAGFVTETVGDAVKSRVKESWSQSTQDQLSDFWQEMPRGVKFNAELIADGLVVEGVWKAATSAGKFAKSKVAPALAADSEVAGGLFKGTRGAAAEVEHGFASREIGLEHITKPGVHNNKTLLQKTVDDTIGVSGSKLASSSKKHLDDVAQWKGFDSWNEFAEHSKLVPDSYKPIGYAEGDKTIGMVFKKGQHNEITIKKAKPTSDYPSQHGDYVSYTVNGNQHVARNGDVLFSRNGDIIRSDLKGNEITLPKDEMRRMGINHPTKHPDVHIPIHEFPEILKKFEGKK